MGFEESPNPSTKYHQMTKEAKGQIFHEIITILSKVTSQATFLRWEQTPKPRGLSRHSNEDSKSLPGGTRLRYHVEMRSPPRRGKLGARRRLGRIGGSSLGLLSTPCTCHIEIPITGLPHLLSIAVCTLSSLSLVRTMSAKSG